MFTVDKAMPFQWQNRISVFVEKCQKVNIKHQTIICFHKCAMCGGVCVCICIEWVRFHFCNDSIMHIKDVKAHQAHNHSQCEIFPQKPSSDIPKPLTNRNQHAPSFVRNCIQSQSETASRAGGKKASK